MGLKLSDKAKKVIGAVAPGLGAALGGPLGGLAGNLIADALGADADAAILSQKPEILAQLKTAELQYRARLRELDINEQEIHLADRADARALARTDMRPQMWLSALFIAGYFLLFGALLTGDLEVPDHGKEVFYMLLGVITVNVPTIMQFWFGSSHGSVQKSEMLNRKGVPWRGANE